MTDFTKQISGYRFARTHHGDTLQTIAFRELGDANEWARLLWLNDLVPPFITDDEALAGDRVLLTGQQIKIPSTVAESSEGDSEATNVLLTDCQLRNGRLTVDPETGDFAVVSGRENLKQAINHRIRTDPGELIYHPEYGCKIQRRKGSKNTAVAVLIGRMDVQDALEQEPRLRRINKITTTGSGDVLSAQADVTPISGDSIQVDASV
jgi:phage baseplate assembly protein W